MEIVRRGVWHFCKLLASSAPPGEVEGVGPKCRPMVADSHHFGGKGASSGVKAVNSFMKFSHDITCLLVVQAFKQGCCQPSLK